MKSTKAMRDRCRELSKPDQDDYDRAVICIIDDLEAMLKWVGQQHWQGSKMDMPVNQQSTEKP